MNLATVSSLSVMIREQYQCSCDFVRAVRVKHTHKGRVLWEGEVGVFRLSLGSDVSECFAWETDLQLGMVEPVIVPRESLVCTPAAAVKSYILGLCGAPSVATKPERQLVSA